MRNDENVVNERADCDGALNQMELNAVKRKLRHFKLAIFHHLSFNEQCVMCTLYVLNEFGPFSVEKSNNYSYETLLQPISRS